MMDASTVNGAANAARIDALLAQLTLEEKAALTVGRDAWTTRPIERLGIPSVWVADGPTGLRKNRGGSDVGPGKSLPATCFPTESALAASWDVDLVRAVAGAIAVEAQAAGVQVVLGPGVNLKRSPLCGRNFEYFSEDPVLSGELAAAFITGLQEHGVGASLKHLVANENETDRLLTDAVMDERTLRELYLRPFEIAVAKAAPWTLMAAYNRLNGSYCCENAHLLRDIVEREWGYRGIVVSDWFAVNDRVAGIEAGLHLQMPGSPTVDAIIAAVREGRLAEQRLDALVRALLAFIFTADAARKPDTPVDLDAHHQLARRAAAESIVLLKNEGGLLPLEGAASAHVALLGAFAQQPRYQGAGSSQVTPVRLVETLHDELIRLIGNTGQLSYAPGYHADGATDPELLRQAQIVAREADVAVVVVGLPTAFEAEGSDRTHIDLPPVHNALVEAVLEAQPRCIVVLLNGSAVALPWAERAPAIVEGWLGGQATGGALADVLLGRVNPSGKLAETFPMRLENTPAYLSFPHDGTGRAPFSEGLFTGYRWYDARRIAPRFPFGHGLSYTTFGYSDLTLDTSTLQDTGTLSVSMRVRNTGTRAGREVVQLYVRELRPRLPRPEQELRAFAKRSLDPDEEQAVRFQLGERDFAVYDPRAGAWAATSGDFELRVGASSRDMRLRASVALEWPPVRPAPFTRLTALRDWLAHPATGDRVRALIHDPRREPAGAPAAPPSFVTDMPIAKLVMFGVLSERDLDRLIETANADLGDPPLSQVVM